MRTATAPDQTGRGRLTAVQGAALYLGAVLGTGVVALPGLTARAAGPASLVAWAGLVISSVPLAATFAALASRYPDAGGVATYVRRAFGADAAAVTGWWFYLLLPVGMPAAALIAGYYVADAFGGGRTTALVAGAALVLLVAVTNAGGVRVSGRAQLVVAGTLVLVLTAAVVIAVPYASADNLTPFAPHGWPAVASAAVLLVWAFAGWEAVTHLAGEFREPGRDIRRATTIAVVVTGVLYLAVAAVVLGVLGAAAGESNASLSALLAATVGGPAPEAAAIIAAVLTFGTTNAYLASGAKLGAALGRDGALPRALAAGSAVGEVPRRSLVLLLACSTLCFAAVAVTGVGLEPLVMMSSACLATVYAAGTCAAIRLLPTGSWGRRAAIVATGLVVVLMVAAQWYLLFPLAVALGAIAYRRLSRVRNRREYSN
ncbi:MAG: amino acid permease [Streptosporangiales bacterium]